MADNVVRVCAQSEIAPETVKAYEVGDRRLAVYSQRRLPAIWRTQAFSSWFLRILLASLGDGQEPGPAVPGGFARGVRGGWVHALQTDRLLARWFAHAYAGVDQE